MASSGPHRRIRWARWVIVAAVVVIVAAIAGPFIYIHLLSSKAPAQLSLKPSATPSAGPASSGAQTATNASLAGTWTVSGGSEAEYRVKEVLLGQSQTAVGISHSVTGRLVISKTTVTTASFSVPMATIKSDKSERDAQFDGRIMDVARYPAGTFALTTPISLAPVPAAGTVRTYTAHGNLTLHGQTHAVTFTLQAQRSGANIKVAGNISVPFAEWGISNPSFGSFVTTQDHGVLGFLLVFSRG